MPTKGHSWKNTAKSLYSSAKKHGPSALAAAKSVYKAASSHKKSAPARKKRGPYKKKFIRSVGMASSQTRPNIYMGTGKVMKVSTAFQKRVIEAASVVNKYNLQQSASATSIIGQASYSGWEIMNSTDLNNINTLISTGANTQKFIVQEASAKLQIANMSSGVAYGTIYMCVPRRDVPTSLGGAANILVNGFAESTTGTTRITAGNLSATPFQSPKFVQYFKIVKVTDFELMPGANTQVLFGQGTKLIHQDFIQGLPAQYFRGLTKFLIIKQYGGVVNDSTTKTLVSTDATKLDFVYDVSYTYKWTNDSSVSTNIINSIPSVTIAEYIQPETGAVQVDTQA